MRTTHRFTYNRRKRTEESRKGSETHTEKRTNLLVINYCSYEFDTKIWVFFKKKSSCLVVLDSSKVLSYTQDTLMQPIITLKGYFTQN